MKLLARMLGAPVRQVQSGEPSVHLTFDDGPMPGVTDRLLECLERHGARATFFLIAERAERDPALVREILARGHSIGNHSLDHRFGAYFGGRYRMLDWVRASEERLAALTGMPTVGFRPPVGVRTPELAWALRELGLPMILWNERFYDHAFRWTRRRAARSLNRIRSGSIVLLHDDVSLETLSFYIEGLKERGFVLKMLERNNI